MSTVEWNRERFLMLISAYSEHQWAAGWMSGIERDIRMADSNDMWIMMAAACDGWPIGYRAEGGWDPLTAEERHRIYEITRVLIEEEPV